MISAFGIEHEISKKLPSALRPIGRKPVVRYVDWHKTITQDNLLFKIPARTKGVPRTRTDWRQKYINHRQNAAALGDAKNYAIGRSSGLYYRGINPNMHSAKAERTMSRTALRRSQPVSSPLKAALAERRANKPKVLP